MARYSPMLQMLQEAEAALQPYGPEGAGEAPLIVQSFGELELEYAAIRKACVLIDQPNRGVVEVGGVDRLGFLNRMLTQELKDLGPFHVRRSFWLSRKGRIDADLSVIDLPSRTLLEMDVHAVERTLAGLASYVISEDVTLRDISEETHRLALHGPTALPLATNLSQEVTGSNASGPAFHELAPGRACVVHLCGHEVVIFRDDLTGETGLEIIARASDALSLYQQLLEFGADPDAGDRSRAGRPVGLGQRIKLRPAGWWALNIARIESGRPLYYLDFGPDSLPAETGVLNDRVSFTKGCYLGQEVVARMHSRGHSKRELVALRFDDSAAPKSADELPPQPVTGSFVFAEGQPEAVGVVTSSTPSPLLGSAPICFAQVRQSHTRPGTRLEVEAEGKRLGAAVQPSLQFVKRR